MTWPQLCSLPKVALTTYKAFVWYTGAPWAPACEAERAAASGCSVGATPGTPRAPSVLVLGGSGGTGSAALQLAKARWSSFTIAIVP